MRMRKLPLLLLLGMISILFSCGKKEREFLTTDEIRNHYYHLQDRGWKSKSRIKKIDAISFTATEVPIVYYILKDMGTDDLIYVDSLYNENKTERVIEFTFEHENGEDLLDRKFTTRSTEHANEYLSLAIDKDFYAITADNDTIKCDGVLHEPHVKLTSHTKVLVFFSGIDPDENIKIIYNDHLFNKGTMTFDMEESYTEILL